MTNRLLLTIFTAFLLIFIIVFSSCSRKKKKTKRLQNFESEVWIADKNGCDGARLDMINQLLLLKYDMRGLKADEIELYLGKPDVQELYDRSQRYYVYFIEPGPKCPDSGENPQALFVRFSAVGIANEFTVRPL
jgi:hypothetical protein